MAGRTASTAAATTVARSTGRGSIRNCPVIMRETSRRSSTIRVWVRVLRSITSSAWVRAVSSSEPARSMRRTVEERWRTGRSVQRKIRNMFSKRPEWITPFRIGSGFLSQKPRAFQISCSSRAISGVTAIRFSGLEARKWRRFIFCSRTSSAIGVAWS